jgi:phosphoglycolate phosphatase
MSDIRAVLFDKDGTLFDFFGTWAPAYEIIAGELAEGDADLALRLLEAGGHDPRSGRIDPRSVLASGTNREIAEIWAPMLGRSDVATLESQLDLFFRHHTATNSHPVTDLPALFGRLRTRGLKLGVATMDSHAAAEAALTAFGIADLVDFFTGYDSGNGTKPGPGMVRAFCRAVGVAESATAVVGDTLHDIAMARAARVGLAVGVLTGATPRHVLSGQADHVLESIAELESLLG